MSIFQAVILGLTQGLTEFIPVSSSGHLVVFPELLGWYEQPLVFDTTMHLATSAALIIFFWRDVMEIVKGFFNNFAKNGFKFRKYENSGKMGLFILVGIIPAGILGLLFDDYIETTFRGMETVALFLILGSVLMWVAEKYKLVKDEDVTFKKSIGIGIFQSLALLPGMSRSGSTISGGMLFGLDREKAARFSFLLSIPIILMAGLYQLVSSPDVLDKSMFLPVILGFAASFLSGLWAINFLLNFLKKNSLKVFVIYRLILAAFLILVSILR